MKKIILLSIISFNLFAVDLSKEIDSLINKHNIPSLSVMILKDGKIIEHIFRGVRKVGSAEQVSENDIYHLGSCAKAFTASVIFKLIENNKLSLGDKVLSHINSQDNKYADITIGDLLSHTAGIEANITGDTWAKLWSFDISPHEGRDIAVKYFLNSKRKSKAGEKFSYSNLGYVLLGKIIENIEQGTFEEIVKRELFSPLNMNSCVFGPVGRDGKTKGPWPHQKKQDGYTPINPEKIESDNPPTYHSVGGISCSQKDWAKFVSAIQGVGENKKFFNKKSRELMLKINKDDYTYGAWGRVKKEWANGDIITHSGSNTLNFSFVAAGVDTKFVFLVNTNAVANEVLGIVSSLKKNYLSTIREKK